VSLAIDIAAVTAVLLPDGWHTVADKSFTIDAYEFVAFNSDDPTDDEDGMIMHSSGEGGVCPVGFSFVEKASGKSAKRTPMSGPLTAIIALRY
jgi:hypothetical protein